MNMPRNCVSQAISAVEGFVWMGFSGAYRRRRRPHLAVITIFALSVGASTFADATPLPADANVLDVTHFGAKGDGTTDDTRAIQAAIDQLPPFDVGHPWQTKIIYFPAGTYLVTDTIQRRDSGGRYLPGLVLIGQSQKGTVIKLADNSPGFQNASATKSMIFTGSGLLGGDPRAGGKDPAAGEGNDAYMNTLENLTLEIGKGNVGAIGLDYLANNIGAVRDVTILADDHARVGLSMTRRWIGPALIERVSISGFDIGIDISRTEYSVTLDSVIVRKSREVGLRNTSNSVPFYDLTIDTESGIGIANIGPQALIVGIKANISGRGEVAFQNTGFANLQRVSIVGSFGDIKQQNLTELNGVNGGKKRVADARWSLPIQSRSIPDESSSSDWVSVKSFGAIADPRVDSTRAINAAFRSGAKTIFFPTGQYKISGSVGIPASVEKIEGLFSTIFADRGPTQTDPKSRYPVFFTEARSTALALRRLIVEGRGGSDAVVEDRVSPPVMLQDIVAFALGFLSRSAEGGSVFAENISGVGGIRLAGPAGVWFRQLNVEAGGAMIKCDGTPLWILGAKTEQTLTLVDASNHASVEVVGGLAYRVSVKPNDPELPFLIASDSRLTAAYAEEAFFPNAVYSVHLQSSTDGRQKLIGATNFPLRGMYGRMVPQVSTDD
jgi:hypothetical protein